jgi:GNAT superfamily N-acetyltransferase
VLRRAQIADADAAADVWLRSFAAALPSVRQVHSDAQVRAWIRDVLIARHETWLITIDGAVVAIMSLSDTDVEQLYLDPPWRGHGLGDMLIAHAKARRPSGLALWTFQVNTPAYRFYRRHGFQETARTDGTSNEEHEPDIRMQWHPATEGADEPAHVPS